MGGAASPLPYQQVTTTSELPQWKKELYGFTKNAPEYSPFKALSRQAGTQAKIIEGMTTRPSWSAMYEAYGVKPGTDLTPYIQASRTGQMAPQAPIPASPAAGDIPEFTAPSEEAKKKAAQGGLMSLRKYASGGDTTPKDLTKAEANRLKRLNDRIGYGQTLSPKDQRQRERLTNQQQAYQTYQNQQKTDASAPSAITQAQAMDVVTPFYDVNQQYGQYGGVTNPIYQQAMDQLRAVSKTPEQFQQATGIMSQAADRLMGMSGYTPQQVTAPTIDRSSIRDIQAQQAQVERYRAAMMRAPTEANVQDYQAAQAQLNQMQGPKSWTDPGTAAQYMNPYTQNVLASQLGLSNRQFAQQQNQLRSQAAQQKAFGGSREALAEQNAQLNQNLANQNMVAQALQQAYGQGMQQFSTEQGQGLQAGQANLSAAQQTALANQQATNQQRQQYVNNALQTAMQSYGGQLTAAQQNQIAQNASAQFNAQSQNTAYNNYVQQQLAAQQANQGMDWNTASQNATMALQAALQNQQAGLTGQGLNLQALNQAGQMGQGIGALGTSMWGQQQNIPQLWGAAGQTVQNLAQQRATGAQQTAQNWLGGMANAYTPVTNMLSQTPGTTAQQNVAQTPR